MGIPKVIHYCWFGGAALPESTKKYMLSWKKYCPDEKDKKKLNYQYRYVRRYGKKFGLTVGKAKYYMDEEGFVSVIQHILFALLKKKREK